jgi:uncharacterized protein (DUF302 family)
MNMARPERYDILVLGSGEGEGRRRTGPPGDAVMPRRRDFVVAVLAAGLAVAATLTAVALTRSVWAAKEPTMNSSDPADTDPVTLPSAHGAGETIERLKSRLAQRKIRVFAHIDHDGEAKKVGLPLRPTQVLIFGNPQAGTPLMQSQQTIGLDLPLRVLVWEDEAGKVWLTYHRPGLLAQHHHVTGQDQAVKALDDAMAALARVVTAE